MKYWPGGEVVPVGDNPPWNMMEMRSMGFDLVDNGSTGTGPTADELRALLIPPGEIFSVNPIIDCRHFLAKTDMARVFNVHGAVAEFSVIFDDPDGNAAQSRYHRLHLLAGLAIENTTGDPTNISLNSVAALIDNQPDGAAAATLTTAAVSYGAPNTGLIEIGFQCGEEFNGQYWPKVVDAIAVVTDQVSTFMNCEIYKSYDGSTWFPVPKAQYNSNGWVGGEFEIKLTWRELEVGGATESGRIFAFSEPQLGCYFKVVFNNAAGNVLAFHEVYGLNHQGEVGFTSDLVHSRQVIALKQGNQLLYDLKNAAILRVGSGPTGPSGEIAQLDATNGVWRDYTANCWYDYSLGAWVRADGTYWNDVTDVWASQSLLTAGSTPSVLDITASKETYTACRQIEYSFRPFCPSVDMVGAFERVVLQLLSLYDLPTHVNTYDSQNVKKNNMTIPSSVGVAGDAVQVRVYNHNNKTSKGLTAWVDPQAQLAYDPAPTAPAIDTAGDGTELSQHVDVGIITPAVMQFADASKSILITRNVLNSDLSGVGSSVDTCLVVRSRHKVDDVANDMVSVAGGLIADAVAWCAEWDTDYAAHIADVTYHDVADATNGMVLAAPAAVLADVVAYVNQAKAKYNAHCVFRDGLSTHVHPLGDVWNLVTQADAVDTGVYGTSGVEALCVAMTAAYNLHLIGNIQGWTEVAASPPAATQYFVDYALGTIEFGSLTQEGNAFIFSYAAEGSTACELSATGAAPWTAFPAVLTYANGVVSAGLWLPLYVRSNLAGFTDERDRPTKVLARYNY